MILTVKAADLDAIADGYGLGFQITSQGLKVRVLVTKLNIPVWVTLVATTTWTRGVINLHVAAVKVIGFIPVPSKMASDQIWIRLLGLPKLQPAKVKAMDPKTGEMVETGDMTITSPVRIGATSIAFSDDLITIEVA